MFLRFVSRDWKKLCCREAEKESSQRLRLTGKGVGKNARDPRSRVVVDQRQPALLARVKGGERRRRRCRKEIRGAVN